MLTGEATLQCVLTRIFFPMTWKVSEVGKCSGSYRPTASFIMLYCMADALDIYNE